MKHLKMLVVSLMALGAMSSVVAQAASAAGKIGTPDGYPVRLTGEQLGEHRFTVEGFTKEVKCPIVRFASEIAAEAETISGVTAEYKGIGESKCKAFGLNATVSMNECTYTLKTGTEIEKEMLTRGTVDIVCPTGKVITIVTATCEVQVGPQTGLGPVDYQIDTSTPSAKSNLTVNPRISLSVKYKETKDGIGCPLTQLGVTQIDGSYEGTTVVRGENPTTLAEKELSIK